MPQMLGKLGLLDVDTIRTVIDSYLIIDQYGGKLFLLGGTSVGDIGDRTFISWPAERTQHVIAISEGIIGQLRESVAKLDSYLR
jgi:hypothetical protein